MFKYWVVRPAATSGDGGAGQQAREENDMEQTWRWFGPRDPVTLGEIRQAEATGIVTALHDVRGRAWTLDEVLARRQLVEAAGLRWSVVESIPVSDDIKTQSGAWRAHIDDWITSLRACAAGGVRTVCYNFMPAVDWTRTNAMWRLSSGGYALRFDIVEFAAYDVFMLRRPGAAESYSPDLLAAAEAAWAAMDEAARTHLERTIITGLPGSDLSYDRETFRRALARYNGIGPDDLRANLHAFLREVVPVAEEVGARLGIHPDDPPFPLFGLPRVVSTAADLRGLLAAVDSPANGLTFCVGSLGARADNDVLAMAREFAPRIAFVHLRDVHCEAERVFHEASHLDGDADMVGIVATMLAEEAQRRAAGRADAELPMRPDHGHLLVDDIGKTIYPGYSCIGRLKGLAELRGVMRAVATLGLAAA